MMFSVNVNNDSIIQLNHHPAGNAHGTRLVCASDPLPTKTARQQKLAYLHLNCDRAKGWSGSCKETLLRVLLHIWVITYKVS